MSTHRSIKSSKILIADNQPVIRNGLSSLLHKDFIICGEIENNHVLKSINHLPVDILIIDIYHDSIGGLPFLKEIRKQKKDLRILVYSSHDEYLYAEQTIRAGAQGYIMKVEDIYLLKEAVFGILKGEIYLSENILQSILRKQLKQETKLPVIPEDVLTEKELKIFYSIGCGLAKNQIAKQLNIEIKIFKKLHEKIIDKFQLKDMSLSQFAINWVRMISVNY